MLGRSNHADNVTQPNLIHFPINTHQHTPAFPDHLADFNETKFLGGGTESTFLIKNPKTNQRFVLKFGADEEAIQLEMLCNAIYRVLSVPVPDMHVYHDLPSELTAKLSVQRKKGVFQLSEYIEDNDKNSKNLYVHAAYKHFIAHVLLGNIDVAKKNNFIKNVLIDAGANFMRRAKGEPRKENASVLSELASLRDLKHNPIGYAWFSSISDYEITEQARKIVNKSHAIEEVIFTAAKKLKMSTELRDTFIDYIADRMDILIARYCIEDKPIARIDKKPHPNQTAAGVLSYFIINDVPHVLLAKRAKHEWWDNFGGCSESEDKSLAMTAAREVAEESNDVLRYSAYELQNAPSHDIITYNDQGMPFTYRMYIMLSDAIDIKKLTDHEHVDYRFVPLAALLESVKKNKMELCEGKATVQIALPSVNPAAESELMMLYPPLFKMLQQSSVFDHLQRALLGKKLKCTHTQGCIKQPQIKKLLFKDQPIKTPTQRRREAFSVMLNKVSLLQSLKMKQQLQVLQAPTVEISQSELYLHMLLENNYKLNQPDDNISLYFDQHFYTEKALTLDEKNRLTDVCRQFIEIEKTNPCGDIYLYHGCDALIAYAYSIYTRLYELLKISEHWPVFRNMNDSEMATVYTNLFLFGSHNRHLSSSLYYFLKNITHRKFETDKAPISLKVVLENFLEPFRVPSIEIEKLVALYETYPKKLGGALYQIRVPGNLIDENAEICDFQGNEKTLHGQYNLNKTLAMLKTQAAFGMKKEEADYMQHLQVRITLPPAKQVSVQKISWYENDVSTKEKAIFNDTFNTITNHIVQSIIMNAASYDQSHEDFDFPLPRLLTMRYQELDVFIDGTSPLSILLHAIKNKKSAVIVSILKQYPDLKYQSVKFDRCTTTPIDMMLHDKHPPALLEQSCGDMWWEGYPVASINDVIKLLPLVKLDMRFMLLFTFKEFLKNASTTDNFVIVSDLKHCPIERKLFISTVLSKNNFVSLLFYAIYIRDMKMVMMLMQTIPHGLKINSTLCDATDYNKTLLHSAVCAQAKELVIMLLKFPGIDPNQLDDSGMTPLSHAIEIENIEIVKILLSSSRININALRLPDLSTPLHLAVRHHKEIVALLLNTPGINLSAVNAKNQTPFMAALYSKSTALDLFFASPHFNLNISSIRETLFQFIDNDKKYVLATNIAIKTAHQHRSLNIKHGYLNVFTLSVGYYALKCSSKCIRTILVYLKQDLLSSKDQFIDYLRHVHLIDIISILSDTECLKIARWGGVITKQDDLDLLLRRLECYPDECEKLASWYVGANVFGIY